ncbi:hypothetical protein ONZ45_g10929 [Pleurotus djamor]|nr:hypothetical protein ONZ45_g10929 [Pleurotus djamor]
MEFTSLPLLVQLFAIGIGAAVVYAFGNNLINQPHPAFTASASWGGGFGTTMTSSGLLLVVVAVCVVLNRTRTRVTMMRILSSIITSLASVVRVFEPVVRPLFGLGQPALEPEVELQAEPADRIDSIDSMESGRGHHLA